MTEAQEPREETKPLEERVKEVIEEFFVKLGAKPKLQVEPLGKKRFRVNVLCGAYESVLIGKGGATLRELRYLINLILRRRKIRAEVDLDIADYLKRQRAFIMNKARAVAKIVRETGKEMSLDPLTPDLRRAVKEALRDEPGIRVYTAGRGREIYVIIAPRKG